MKREEKAFLAIVTERVEHVTLSLTLDTRKREVKLPVAVRVNANRQTMYHRTGLRCTLDEWQDIFKSAKRGANFETKKAQLVTYNKVKAALTDLLNNNSFTFDQLKSRLTGKQAMNFSEYWLNLADTKKIGTRQCYIDAYNSFTDIVGLNVEFTSVSIPLIKRWEAGMTKKGRSVTTIGIYYRAARAVINAAMAEGYINPSQYPFGKNKVVIRKGRSRTDEYLPVPEIKRLMAFKAPEGYWFPSYEKVIYEAINFWLFSYLGNGLNMADMAVLRYDDHYFQSGRTELKFIRQKTADTSEEVIEVIIPVIPELQNILSKYGAKPEKGAYVFPQILNEETDPVKVKKIVSQWNSNVQDRVIAACKLIGIDKPVSMTWARHSFATNLTNAGISERYISQAMGHSIKSVTQGYIGLFPPKKRMEFNQKLLEE